MNNIETFLLGRRIGIVSAHPDDHLIHGNLLHAARTLGAPVRELTLTRGRASTINHLGLKNRQFVRQGGRVTEGERAAYVLGMLGNEHLDLPDGNLAADSTRRLAVYAIAAWADMHSIDTFVTLGALQDHDDHQASAAAARRAAAIIGVRQNIGIDVLELQPGSEGQWTARGTPEATHVTYGAAAVHASQFMVAHTVQPGWIEIVNGISAHPHTAAGLRQYPIARDAAYNYVPAATLARAVL
jgi:LmbE family N-acetylglucosaminyl deacetylase